GGSRPAGASPRQSDRSALSDRDWASHLDRAGRYLDRDGDGAGVVVSPSTRRGPAHPVRNLSLRAPAGPSALGRDARQRVRSGRLVLSDGDGAWRGLDAVSGDDENTDGNNDDAPSSDARD